MGKSFSNKEIEDGLLRKGFLFRDNDHKFLQFYLEDRKTHIFTKVSHGKGGKTVPAWLLSKMARQCALETPEFRDLVDCTMSQEEYSLMVQNALDVYELPWDQGFRLPPIDMPRLP